MMDIEFKGQYNTATIRRAVEAAQAPTRPLQMLRLAALLTSLLVILYAGQNAIKDRTLNTLEIIVIIIPLAIVIYFFLEPWLKKRNLAKLIRDDRQPALMAGKITNEGVVYYKSPANHVPDKVIRWEAFNHAGKARDLLALLTVDGVLAILPRSFFQSDEDWDKVNALVKEAVKPKRIR